MPRRFGGVRVVTVHDLTMVDNPEWHERSKVVFFTQALRRAARAADAIVVPSQATADRLEAVFSPRCEVKVIPHGITMPNLLGNPASNRAAEHLLYVGTIEPRKGIVDLVAAFDRLAETRADLHLTIVGQLGWKFASVVESIERSPFRQRIDVRGYVDDQQLARLFLACSVFVYPSLAEGFGLPVLEAMAYGAPVVTTRDSAMAEVSSGVATHVSAGSVEELAEGIAFELRRPAGQAERLVRGREIARNYSWERSARSHLDLYRSIAS
jgi:glycosyltransferase involved in cell wall biosynthesis